MSVKKNVFEKYAQERENTNLTNALNKKAGYSHHKVFDKPDFQDIIKSEDYEQVLLIETSKLDNWLYSDRPESELGDIQSLAEDFKIIGQQQPCIVRPNPIKPGYYELIAGERRWHAAKLAGLKLKVISKDLSNKEAALIQSAENESRKGLSDYAKGINYGKLINQGILQQKDLTDILKISKQQVSRLLSFNKIPSVVIDEIGDLSKVSARTAEQIKQLCSKGEEFILIIINNAKLIRQGKLGARRLTEISNIKNISTEKDMKIVDNNDLFFWKLSDKNIWSMDLSPSVSNLISKNKIISSELKKDIQNVIEKYLPK
jgi:ParB family chromosome partitioning protein